MVTMCRACHWKQLSVWICFFVSLNSWFYHVQGQEASATTEHEVKEDVVEQIKSEVVPVPKGLSETFEPASVQELNEEMIKVNDYLETLDTSELLQICVDRGFDVIPRKDGLPLERTDYLEAARRCLSLEDEMNAILARNPELAAELEAEIARMQQHKERLEAERESLLAEKSRLEAALKQAGVELMEANQQIKPAIFRTDYSYLETKPAEDMTFKEVMIFTLSKLFDRVRQDVELVRKFTWPVLKPVLEAIKMMWRHLKPHAKLLWEELIKRANQIFLIAKGQMAQKLGRND